MQIAFLLYKYFPYGGMQRDFMRFAQEAASRGHQCRAYVISWQGELPDDIEVRKVPVRALRRVSRNRRFLSWVQSDLAKDPVDGIVGFNKMPGLDIYFAADPCYLDMALHERSALYRRGARFAHFTQWERAVFAPPSNTHILQISESEQQKFVQHYGTPAQRMSLLPPGVSRDACAGSDAAQRRSVARQTLGLESQEFMLLFVGSGFITKGLERALIAFANLRFEQPSINSRLLIVGQDKMRPYRRLSARLGVADKVEFLGPRDDVVDLMLAADLLVHPAVSEAGGVVLLEAIVAGLPLIVTAACGYANHVAAARAGIVLRTPFSQTEFNRAVLRCIDGVYRAECRRSALDYAANTDLYSMHQIGTRLMLDILAGKKQQINA